MKKNPGREIIRNYAIAPTFRSVENKIKKYMALAKIIFG
jgi:hypothetical protein